MPVRRRLLLVALCCTTIAALGAGLAALGQAPQASPQAPATAQTQDPQRPTFRTAVNFVRVDVYPRADDRPVDGLAAGDFEVLENGVVQKLTTFEHVVIRGGTEPEARVEPKTLHESNQAAADPRNRLFVLFFDTFHVTDPAASHNARTRMPGSRTAQLPEERRIGPPSFVDSAIQTFLRRTVGPDDLLAMMTPEMEPGELTFVRRPDSIEAFLKTTWARRFSLDNLTPDQERYLICYDPDDRKARFDGVAEEMIAREREAGTISALGGLVRRLGDIREERKGVLLISEGWALHRPNAHLARKLEDVPPPQPPGIHIGTGGRPASGIDPRITAGSADWQKCEAARIRLAYLDNEVEFRRVLDDANRANASFYAIDPRGLAAFDTPINFTPLNPPAGTDGERMRRTFPGEPVREVGTADKAQIGRPGAADDVLRLTGRLEALATAASATDGLALTKSNDLTASLARIVDDLSNYYLLGYYSTNAKSDGSYRRIDVRVKRPGVEVRARRGYRAATAEEVAARAAAAAAPGSEVAPREHALVLLDRAKADRPMRMAAGFAWTRPSEADPPAPLLWVVGEVDGSTLQSPEWRNGGVVGLAVSTADGAPVLTERVEVSAAARAFVRFVPLQRARSGEWVVRLRGQAGSLPAFTDGLRLTGPPAAEEVEALPGDPVVYRRGPSTGPAYQPTADPRFRRTERLRADIGTPSMSLQGAARLLDRRGQALDVPVTVVSAMVDQRPTTTVELVLAPLGPGDYLIEISFPRGARTKKVLVAFRVVP